MHIVAGLAEDPAPEKKKDAAELVAAASVPADEETLAPEVDEEKSENFSLPDDDSLSSDSDKPPKPPTAAAGRGRGKGRGKGAPKAKAGTGRGAKRAAENMEAEVCESGNGAASSSAGPSRLPSLSSAEPKGATKKAKKDEKKDKKSKKDEKKKDKKSKKDK